MIGKIIDSYKRWQRRRSLRGRRGPDFARGDHAVCVQEGPWIYFETGDISDNGPAVGECREYPSEPTAICPTCAPGEGLAEDH